jgi:hypothetical protein
VEGPGDDDGLSVGEAQLRVLQDRQVALKPQHHEERTRRLVQCFRRLVAWAHYNRGETGLRRLRNDRRSCAEPAETERRRDFSSSNNESLPRSRSTPRTQKERVQSRKAAQRENARCERYKMLDKLFGKLLAVGDAERQVHRLGSLSELAVLAANLESGLLSVGRLLTSPLVRMVNSSSNGSVIFGMQCGHELVSAIIRRKRVI